MLSLAVNQAGSKAMQDCLAKLKKKASKEQIVKALEAGGKVLQKTIEDGTPVRHDSPSGDALAPGQHKGDIHVTVDTEHDEPTVRVGPGPDTAKVMRWLEYGHEEVRSSSGKDIKFVPAQPVMRPAWEASSDEAIQVVIDTLKEHTGE